MARPCAASRAAPPPPRAAAPGAAAPMAWPPACAARSTPIARPSCRLHGADHLADTAAEWFQSTCCAPCVLTHRGYHNYLKSLNSFLASLLQNGLGNDAQRRGVSAGQHQRTDPMVLGDRLPRLQPFAHPLFWSDERGFVDQRVGNRRLGILAPTGQVMVLDRNRRR